jgi:hypothetical protein
VRGPIAGEQERRGAGVIERAVPSADSDVGCCTAGGQATARQARQVVAGKLHGAHHGRRGHPDAAAIELGFQEARIEGNIVADDHPPGEQLPERGRGLRERRSLQDVCRPDAMNTRRADIAARIDQRAELTGDLAVAADVHHRDLNDAVRPRVQPGGFDVHDGESLRRRSLLPEAHSGPPCGSPLVGDGNSAQRTTDAIRADRSPTVRRHSDGSSWVAAASTVNGHPAD